MCDAFDRKGQNIHSAPGCVKKNKKKLLRWQFVFIASVEHGRPGFSFISWIIYAHQPLFHEQYLIALKHK